MCCTYARDMAAGPTSWKALLAGKPEGAPKQHVRPSCGHVPASCCSLEKGKEKKERKAGEEKRQFHISFIILCSWTLHAGTSGLHAYACNSARATTLVGLLIV